MKRFIVDTNAWARAVCEKKFGDPRNATPLELREIREKGHPGLIRNEVMNRLANRRELAFTPSLLREMRRMAGIQEPDEPYIEETGNLTGTEKARMGTILGLVGQIIARDPAALVPSLDESELREHDQIIMDVRTKVGLNALTGKSAQSDEVSDFESKFMSHSLPGAIPELNATAQRMSIEELAELDLRRQEAEAKLVELGRLEYAARLETLDPEMERRRKSLKRHARRTLATAKRIKQEMGGTVWTDLETLLVAKRIGAEVVSGDINCKILGLITQTPVAHIRTDDYIAKTNLSKFEAGLCWRMQPPPKSFVESDGWFDETPP